MAGDSGLTGACRDNPETWPASPKLPGPLQQTLAMGSSWCSLKRERERKLQLLSYFIMVLKWTGSPSHF